MNRENETHVVILKAVINPDTQDPVLERGEVRHINDVVRIADILGIDHVAIYLCSSLSVAHKVASGLQTSTIPESVN